MSDDAMKAFLGTGWAFPVAVSPQGEIETAAYEEDVRQAIRIILGTNLGERVMRPDFGAGLRAVMFEPMTTTTLSLVQHHVERALVATPGTIRRVPRLTDAPQHVVHASELRRECGIELGGELAPRARQRRDRDAMGVLRRGDDPE